jgi:hypothetical protein
MSLAEAIAELEDKNITTIKPEELSELRSHMEGSLPEEE